METEAAENRMDEEIAEKQTALPEDLQKRMDAEVAAALQAEAAKVAHKVPKGAVALPAGPHANKVQRDTAKMRVSIEHAKAAVRVAEERDRHYTNAKKHAAERLGRPTPDVPEDVHHSANTRTTAHKLATPSPAPGNTKLDASIFKTDSGRPLNPCFSWCDNAWKGVHKDQVCTNNWANPQCVGCHFCAASEKAKLRAAVAFEGSMEAPASSDFHWPWEPKQQEQQQQQQQDRKSVV